MKIRIPLIAAAAILLPQLAGAASSYSRPIAEGLLLWDSGSRLEACNLFEREAAKGDAAGLYYYGSCFLVGTGRPKDRGQAEALFQRAAKAKSVDALYVLGLMHEADGEISQRYLALAAISGHVEAGKRVVSVFGSGALRDKPRAGAKVLRTLPDRTTVYFITEREGAGWSRVYVPPPVDAFGWLEKVSVR